MDMEMNEDLGTTFDQTIDRLTAAAGILEQTVERLEAKLAAAEQSIAELQASAATPVPASSGRKTLPTQMTTLLSKQGIAIDNIEAGSIDAALSSLSIEQRIAVKSQLLRAGLLT